MMEMRSERRLETELGRKLRRQGALLPERDKLSSTPHIVDVARHVVAMFHSVFYSFCYPTTVC